MSGELGRFGHHPDPATDYEIEVQALESIISDKAIGLRVYDPMPEKRLRRALDFRVGGVPTSVSARALLLKIEALAPKSQS